MNILLIINIKNDNLTVTIAHCRAIKIYRLFIYSVSLNRNKMEWVKGHYFESNEFVWTKWMYDKIKRRSLFFFPFKPTVKDCQ